MNVSIETNQYQALKINGGKRRKTWYELVLHIFTINNVISQYKPCMMAKLVEMKFCIYTCQVSFQNNNYQDLNLVLYHE